MNDYISKPIDVKEMFSTIAKWVKVKQTKLPGNPCHYTFHDG